MALANDQSTIYKLGELGTFRNGVNFGKISQGITYRLINVKDLFNDTPYIHFNSLDEVQLPETKGFSQYHVRKHDIFFVRSSVKRDGIGYVSLANKSDDGIVHCGFVIRFRLNSSNVAPLYLAYLLRSPMSRSQLIGSSGGAAIINISQEVLSNFDISIPPLPTQKKIAAILSAYDDLIENNERRIRILEDMAQNLYREWFVKFRFPNHEKVKMVDSPLGKIPQGWEVGKLSDVVDVNKRSIKNGEEPDNIVYVDIASVGTGTINQKQAMSFVSAPGRARRLTQHGDIIWSCVRPNRKSYSLILYPESNMVVSTGFAVISGKNIPFTYLYHALTTNDFVGYLTNHARGAAYPAVTSEDFENAVILLPHEPIVSQFHEIVCPMLELKHGFTQRNTVLRRTRDLLLPKLISGEVDVSESDIETSSKH